MVVVDAFAIGAEAAVEVAVIISEALTGTTAVAAALVVASHRLYRTMMRF